MGYKTEINYILKCSSEQEGEDLRNNLKPGSVVVIKKSGFRTFVLDSPIMIADENWTILGMCKINQAKISFDQTELTAVILTVFSEVESKVATKLIQDAEKVKERY